MLCLLVSLVPNLVLSVSWIPRPCIRGSAAARPRLLFLLCSQSYALTDEKHISSNPNAGFRLACRSPVCRSDGDILHTTLCKKRSPSERQSGERQASMIQTLLEGTYSGKDGTRMCDWKRQSGFTIALFLFLFFFKDIGCLALRTEEWVVWVVRKLLGINQLLIFVYYVKIKHFKADLMALST